MTTTYQQIENGKQSVRRRATSKGLSFGPVATAITMGVVAVLLGVTFIGDWLRTPSMTIEASPSIISPNGDRNQDSANFSYVLNEDADVVVQILDGSGNLVQTLISDQFQTRGQHVALWNGTNRRGQVVADGEYQAMVTGKGTVRAAQQATAITVDTVPPTLRLANLNETTRVREANFTIEGITDPNAVVRVSGDPQLIPVDAEGKFSIKRQLTEGSNQIEVSATDPAGNSTNLVREVVLATTPPEVTITGPSNDLWTNESMIPVSGVAPMASLVRVNGQEVSVNNQSGEFVHEVILQEGENIVQIEATDDVGNTTSQEILVQRKTAPPVLNLNVEDTTNFQQSEIQIMGTTEAGASVMIGGKAVSISPLGEFQTMVQLQQGENMLEVVAQDQAGNVTRRQKVINYQLTPPESEFARVTRNLPSISSYLGPVLISLPILLLLAYFLTRPVSLVLSAESNSFRPGLPNEGRFLRLAVDLSKAARTTVEVKDRQGNTIATLSHRRHRRAGQQTLYWNGYNDFGQVVPPGEYTVHATAATTGGTVTSMLNIAIVEDPRVHRQVVRSRPQRTLSAATSQKREYFRNGGRTRQKAQHS